jgi:hypothetical protein
MSKVKSIKGETTEQHEKNLAIVQRYCLVSDNSGHKYAIPVHETDAFYQWVEITEDDERMLEYTGEGFDSYRVDGRFTFTDPRTN